MWSLGCVIHELLTSKKVFSEVGGGEADFMTGLDTSFDVEESQVSMELLFNFCTGRSPFDVAILESSEASAEAIDLVMSLLVVEPTERATASVALQNPWLVSIEFKNDWFKKLEADFSALGIELDLGTRQDKALMRQIRSIDITRFLPTATAKNLPALLEQAIDKGLTNAAWMLVHSPGRIVKDPTGVERLFEQAVKDRRLRWVKILLEVGDLDINRVGSSGKRAVEVAVHHGWCDILRLLIKSKAVVDVEAESSHEGRTPLQTAAGSGDIDMVRVLLEDNENIEAIVNANPATKFGRTALQAAAEKGHINVMQFLISNAADINAKPISESGRTALQAAVESGHIHAALLLLRNNADVIGDGDTVNGTTALWTATSNGDIEMVRLLLEHDANANDHRSGRMALRAGVESGRLDIVQLLLEFNTEVYSGEIPKAVGDGGIDPAPVLLEYNGHVSHAYQGKSDLQVAIEYGRLDIAQLLLQFKAVITDELFNATVRSGPIETVRFLLDNGASVGDDNHQKTALQVAINRGSLDMVILLLQRGANITDATMDTAIRKGKIGIIRILLENNADVNNDWGNKLALLTAVQGGRIDVVILLVQYKAKINGESFHTSIRHGYVDIVRLLLVNDVDVNSVHEGLSALHVAVTSGHLDVVKVLLHYGADVEYYGPSQSRTPLQSAAGFGRLDLTELLLDYNADINANPVEHASLPPLEETADAEHIEVPNPPQQAGAVVNTVFIPLPGRTALQAAAENGDLELVNLLVSRGAIINAAAAPGSGLTALQAAAGGGHLAIAKFLLKRGANINAAPAIRNGMTAYQAARSTNNPEMVGLFTEPHTLDGTPNLIYFIPFCLMISIILGCMLGFPLYFMWSEL